VWSSKRGHVNERDQTTTTNKPSGAAPEGSATYIRQITKAKGGHVK
jgi:hypothetical protein